MTAASSTEKPINLLRGWPNPSLLPTSALLRASQSVLSDPSISVPGLLYGPDPGFQPLREEISKWLGDFYGGSESDADRICITGGASQNLACVLQTLKRSTPWSKIYSNIIYCVPTFSNPSGKTMSLSSREALVKLARKYDALVVTDDVYDFLQFSTSPSTSSDPMTRALLPRLVDIDRTLEPVPPPDSFGNAMSNGSFSKIAGPGVRTGWAEATPKFTYGLSQCGSSRSGGAPSQLAATMMTELLKNGELQTHIEKVLNPAYKRRYEIMVLAIQKHLIPLGIKLGEVSFEGKAVFGGYFIWLELPETADAERVTEIAKREHSLIVAPGHIFEVSDDASVPFAHSLRLCFSWEEESDLEEAIVRLARAVRDVVNNNRAWSSLSVEGGLDKQGLKQGLGEFQ
ncbi:hypothetical protein LZ554_003237 [Drepanopeziza brunnea f. sp. 'monogermtubi']|nr:hypothetical protein LZ554_003237 [Drepanopeziza brunnea f. sp. 'monogermtubi']